MAPKPVNIFVDTVDANLKFVIYSNTTGKELFDQVVKTVGIREIWFFGLLYIDSKDFPCWLKHNKKVLRQDLKKTSEPLKLKFRARFYPEDVSEELIQEITQKLFYLQVKDSVLLDEIYCPAETCVLLASYAMQAKHGNFNEDLHQPETLINERLLPRRVVEQFQLSAEEWAKRVINWWKEHRGLLKEEATLEYLKIAQDLEMYGVNYFDIRNKKGTELYLGVDALGLNIYDKQDKLTPKIGFPWSEIRNISFNDKKFVIKPMEKKSPDFIFYAPRLRINRRILSLCMGNHELYMRRRKPDTPEVQQLKARAQEEKLARLRERERIQAEFQSKQVEQDRAITEKRLADLERSAEEARRALEAQNQLAKELDEKRRQAEEAELRLQQKHEEDEREHEKMMERINYEQREKEKIVLQAQKGSNNNHYSDQSEESERPNENAESDDEENSTSPNGGGVELDTNENASRHEENRTPTTTRDQNMKRKLEAIKNELGSVQNSHQITDNDRLHEQNVASGRDKYKTLKMIRQGNTKKRIDEFESM